MCRIKDIKNSVRDVFREELNREDANRDLLLNEYTKEIRSAIQPILNDLVNNDKEYLRIVTDTDNISKLSELSVILDTDSNLLRYISENYSDHIIEIRNQYREDIEKLENSQTKMLSQLGEESDFIRERIDILKLNIENLGEIIDKIDKYQSNPNNDEKDEDDYDYDYAEESEHRVDALEEERGEDDIETTLDVMEQEVDGFDREGHAAKKIRKLLEKERKNASTKAFNEVATKTVKDPVTNDLNEKLEAIKKDNPQCKLPQYAINPIKIAALKKMRQNVDASVGFCFSNMTLLATKLFSSFPKYSSLILSKWFHDLSKLYNFDWHDFADFSRKLDWVYLYLFIMSSVPFLGFWSDLLIIVRAIKEGRGFLSILTFVTSFISMFTFHMIDVGMIIKLLYFLDTTSYNSAKYDGSKPNMIDSDVVFSRGSVDFNVAKDFISGKTRKKSKKEDKSFFSGAEDMMESMIKEKEKEKGIVHDEDDDNDDFSGPSQFSDDKKTGIKHRKKQISQEDKCESNLKKLVAIMENENIDMNPDEFEQIIDNTKCNYKKALNQIIEKVGGKEQSDGDDDEDDDEDHEVINTSKKDYVRNGTKDIKPDGKVINKRISRTDDEAGIASFKRNPIADKDEDDDMIMVDEDGKLIGEYGTLPDSSDANANAHPWHRCPRYNYITDPSKRKLEDYCHRCYDPIDNQFIGGKDPEDDFGITNKEIIETFKNDIKNKFYPINIKPDWEFHYNLLSKFMDNKTIGKSNQSLDKIRDMLKEPEQSESDEEYVIDDEEVDNDKNTKKTKSKIQPDINPATGIFGQIGKIGQFGKSNNTIIVDDDEEIDVDKLTKPESGVGYPRDFGKQHQEIEKFKPCAQPGVDCTQSIHGIAYKPNYKTNVCEKVKLVAKPNLFGTSIVRDKPDGAKEYTIVGIDRGGARNRCQEDLNNEISIDLTKDIGTDVDKKDVTKITKYLSELRQKYGKLINNKKDVIADWNKNKSELEKIVINANHGIKPTGKYGFDIGVHKCIPYTYTNSRDGFKKGNCVWAPSGKKAVGDDITMNWKPEGKLYKKNERDACQTACVNTLNNGSENSGLVRELKEEENMINTLLRDGYIEKIINIIENEEFTEPAVVPKKEKKVKKETKLTTKLK